MNDQILSKRTARPMKLTLAAAILGVVGLPLAATAQDTNTLELIKQLQKRIDDLELKVKTLESEKEAVHQASDAKLKQQVQDLDQQVKTLERNRQADQEAAAAK